MSARPFALCLGRPTRCLLTAGLLAGGLLAVGCGSRPASEPTGAPDRRIAVMAPAAAEMLEALERTHLAVAIGDFGPWPTGLESLPSAGRFDQPNLERVLSLRADMLLTTASEAGTTSQRRLSELGVEVVALDTRTYDGIFDSLLELGRVLGCEERARGVADEMRAAIEAIESTARELPTRRVLFVVGRDPLYVAGPGSHIDRMIALAGGENVAHDALSPYQQVSIEAILTRRPDVIIDSSDNRPDALRGRRPGGWSRWPFLPAVERDRVYWVDPSRLVIPGMRLPEMTRLMGRLIHPEAFGEASLEDMSRRDPAVATAP